MLVLTRKDKDVVYLMLEDGREISIKTFAVPNSRKMRLGIIAPTGIRVERGEVRERAAAAAALEALEI